MICWLDTTAGVAGDMLLGALVDAGAPLEAVQAAVDLVVPGAVRLTRRPVVRQGQRATKVEVEVLVDDPPHRTWASVRTMIEQAGLYPETAERALRVFRLLAEAEGHVHGTDPEQVHFHEVGALDAVADVVGVAEAVRLLGVDEVVGTVVAVGEGSVWVAHGLMPVPVPAVAQLAVGWPTRGGGLPYGGQHGHQHDHGGHSHEDRYGQGEHHHDEHAHGDHHDHGAARHHGEHHHHDHGAHAEHHHGHHEHQTGLRPVGELATPTGMALVRALARRWGDQPAMVTRAVGVGAGTKDTPGRPNVVRVVLGEPAPVQGSGSGAPTGETRTAQGLADQAPAVVTELAANVDDLDPRLWPGVLDRLLAEGALDAWLVPVTMKRGRPGQVLTVLARPQDADRLSEVVFATTSTIGVRRTQRLERRTLDRCWFPVETAAGQVRVKVAHRDQVIVQATPEFADVVEAAARSRREQREVLRLAEAAAVGAGLVVGARLPAASG